MDTTMLLDYHQALYTTFTRAGDTLFDVREALLTAEHARSFVELSQAPRFQRRWPSRYAALRDGRSDRDALRRLFARHAPRSRLRSLHRHPLKELNRIIDAQLRAGR